MYLHYVIRFSHVIRCTFHIFTQEWRSIPRNLLGLEDLRILVCLKNWVNSWIFSLSKPEQFQDSFSKFKTLLETKKCEKVRQYVEPIILSMEVSSAKWAYCYKKPKMDLMHCTTSPGESANSSLKRFDKGNMSKKSLQRSSELQRNHSTALQNKREAAASVELLSNTTDEVMIDQNMVTGKYGININVITSLHYVIT